MDFKPVNTVVNSEVHALSSRCYWVKTDFWVEQADLIWSKMP